MLVQLGIAIAFYALPRIYHRLDRALNGDPKSPRDPDAPLQIPTSEPGAAVPIVYGRCRVRQPILVYTGALQTVDVYRNDDGAWTEDSSDTPSHRTYALDMLFSAGIGMGSGSTRGASLSGNKLHNVWWGSRKLPVPAVLPILDSTLRFGQMVSRPLEYGGAGAGGGLRGAYYWHGGWTDQSLMSPASKIGDSWATTISDTTLVPGLAKEMLLSLVRMPEDSSDPYFDQTVPDVGGTTVAVPYPQEGFIIGESPNVQGVSLEVSSYGDIVSGVSNHIFSMTRPGIDFDGGADPVECIYDILTGTYGKLALPTSLIDMVSFGDASQTLKSENHGYNRCFDSAREAKEWIEEILRQIDGVLRFNRKTNKIEIKLIRPDYSYSSLLTINRKNCQKLTGGAMNTWDDGIQKVRVKYPNREKEYEYDSEAAQNPGTTEGQQLAEEVLDFPGCTSPATALKLAERELAWRSEPMMKLTAWVDRSFLRLSVGDPVIVNYTDPDIAGIVFRIAAKNDGKLGDPTIILTLVKDVNYVWRHGTPTAPGFGGLRDKTTDPRLL